MVSNDKSFWEQIDAILVINLPHRSDRWTQLLDELESIGVAHKAVRIDAIDGKKLSGYEQKPWFRKRTPDPVARMKAGSAGCCLSHRKAIKLAKERGYKKILLMEDDADFKGPLKDEMGDFLGRFIQDESRWDMLYLGFYMKKCPYAMESTAMIQQNQYNIWRIRGPLMFHATVINSRIFDHLLEGLPRENNIWPWMTYWGSIDSWITNSFGRNPKIKIAGCRPNLVVQKANYSDICGRVLSIEESEGTHKPTELIPLKLGDLKKAIRLSFLEKIHQTIKRSCRVLKAYLFGYSKT
jgi:glycosyl transferase, family 25